VSEQAKYQLTPIADQHRAESHKLILHAADMVKSDSVLILGVGTAEEIPIVDLAARFGKVLLNDIDTASLEATYARLGIPQQDKEFLLGARSQLERELKYESLSPERRAKITLVPADLTGATESLAKSATETLASETDPASAASALGARREVVQPPELQHAEKFDLVVASCIVSQLHVPATERIQEAFVAKFPGQLVTLQKSTVWLTALARYAQKTEAALVSSLAGLVSPQGRIVFSESVQAVFFEVSGTGQWLAEGTHRMIRTANLVDLLDARFRVYTKSRWNWVIIAEGSKRGRAFDVQGLIVGPNC
jgi:hypothetical protein